MSNAEKFTTNDTVADGTGAHATRGTVTRVQEFNGEQYLTVEWNANVNYAGDTEGTQTENVWAEDVVKR